MRVKKLLLYRLTKQHEKAVITGKLIERREEFEDFDTSAEVHIYACIAEEYAMLHKGSYAAEYIDKIKALNDSEEFSDEIDYLTDISAEY